MTGKDRLLFRLKQAGGNWVSGEGLSSEMAMTRSAVWKHIRRMRREGYDIESSPRKGYRLRGVPEGLNPLEIRSGLGTRIFGRGIIDYAAERDSTNNRAKELAAGGAAEGTVVLAEKQTGGRGRRGRSWFSPAGGGIYASLILKPLIPSSEAPKITLVAAVALCEALRAVCPGAYRVKWPNDVLVGGRKLAGILTELSTEPDAVDYVVVGLGLNVNIRPGDFPGDLRGKATSLMMETGEPHSRAAVLRTLLEHFERLYEHFREGDFAAVLRRWKVYADLQGRNVSVEQAQRRIVGKVHGIDRDGSLLLRDSRGVLQRIVSGDVTYLS